MAYKTITVDVDIDLDDFSDDDLIEELESRKKPVNHAGSEALQKMFRALSLGDEKQALNLLRDYLCDVLGRML